MQSKTTVLRESFVPRSIESIKQFLVSNMVTIMFVILSVLGYKVSGMTPFLFFMDITARISRNAFLVLALIIPVMAGMGLNFSIVLGAMAAQAVVIFVTHWGIGGLPGIVLAVALVTPLAALLGFLTGTLFNRTKGQEMIAGLILGYFAQGVYELIFLQLVGSLIPMSNPRLIMGSGVGVRTTIDLTGGLKYGLDWPGQYWGNDLLLRPTLPWTALGLSVLLALVLLAYQLRAEKRKRWSIPRMVASMVGIVVIAAWSIVQIRSNSQINWIRVPLLTWLVIGAACVGLHFFSKTKLGQDMRSVGQNRHVAAVAGIDVNRVRIKAIILSMVMAAWGHIIFLQNLGTFSTYGSHEQVGLYSAAALLIGGATVAKASIKHAVLGTILFHTLFIVAPAAGRQLFGDAQIGEYFRVFVAYGVIGITLAMHAWKHVLQSRSDAKPSGTEH